MINLMNVPVFTATEFELFFQYPSYTSKMQLVYHHDLNEKNILLGPYSASDL